MYQGSYCFFRFWLLRSQRNHWIHASSAPRRNETGDGRDQREQSRDHEVDRRIERLHFEQDVLERVREEHAEQQGSGARAEKEADRELPRALFHDHSVTTC